MQSQQIRKKAGTVLRQWVRADTDVVAKGPRRLTHYHRCPCPHKKVAEHVLRPYMRLAVIGDPVAHSQSPRLHAAFLREAEVAGSYEAIRVASDGALDALERLFSAGYLGLNVTTPLKELVLGAVYAADPIVRSIAAANTLIATPSGWHAANTDGIGAFCSVYTQHTGTALDPRDADGTTLAASVLIIGTGPTARAAAYTCLAHGMRVAMTSRNSARLQGLCMALGADIWTPALPVDIILSTAPPDAQLDPALQAACAAVRVLIDANYGDRSTLSSIVRRPVVDGSGMLAAQARASFERWRLREK